MSTLTTLQLVIFAFAPLAVTFAIVACVVWIRTRNLGGGIDRAQALLEAAVRRMPEDRRNWGAAMLAELDYVSNLADRWWFALGCARVALLPPGNVSWPRYVISTLARLGPVCGALSVALPPLGLPLLYLAAITADAFTTHDDFFNGELVPGIIGSFILCSIACILAGIPLGIAGLIRREQARWLSVMGVVSSVYIFSYLQIVQYLAGKNLG